MDLDSPEVSQLKCHSFATTVKFPVRMLVSGPHGVIDLSIVIFGGVPEKEITPPHKVTNLTGITLPKVAVRRGVPQVPPVPPMGE